ncbi:MAG TPA: GlsB/YeaQ/YmgE family stress response membrane protein [Candidatus Acidoferrales bacterium]|nr:GlsB/YeaQ/YmgE family stress response membrane protein [Candidatus Acidoferrales bacterium]
MWLVWTIVIGILAGWIAGRLMKGRDMGLLMDLVVGIVGSVLGGWLFAIVGLAAYGLIARLIMAIVGAVFLLWLVKVLKRA